jgi:NADH-ubiquinone oxidoreductase chain 6
MMLNLQLTELSAVGTEYTQNLPLGTIIGSRIKIFGAERAL